MKCSICGKEIKGYGNNPEPLRHYEDGACCDSCNELVMAARDALTNFDEEEVLKMRELFRTKETIEDIKLAIFAASAANEDEEEE